MKISFNEFKKRLVESLGVCESASSEQSKATNSIVSKAYKITELFPCVYQNLGCKPFTMQDVVLDKASNTYKLSRQAYTLVNRIGRDTNPLRYTSIDSKLGDEMNSLLGMFTGDDTDHLSKKLEEAGEIWKMLNADFGMCYWTPAEEGRQPIGDMQGQYEDETDIVAVDNSAKPGDKYVQISLKADAATAKNAVAKRLGSWKMKNRSIDTWFKSVDDEELQTWLEQNKWYETIVGAANDKFGKLSKNWKVVEPSAKVGKADLKTAYGYVKRLMLRTFANPEIEDKRKFIERAMYKIRSGVESTIRQAFVNKMQEVADANINYFKLIVQNSLGYKLSTEEYKNPLIVWVATEDGCADYTSQIDRLARSISDSAKFTVEKKAGGAVIKWTDAESKKDMALGLQIRLTDPFKGNAALTAMIDRDLNPKTSRLSPEEIEQLSQVADLFWNVPFASFVKSPRVWKVQVEGIRLPKSDEAEKTTPVTENTKVTLTIRQLKKLIKESTEFNGFCI